MWKKYLGQQLHDGWHVIHNKFYELLSVHTSISSSILDMRASSTPNRCRGIVCRDDWTWPLSFARRLGVTKVGNVMVTLWQRLVISEMKTRFWPCQPCTNTRISQQPHKHGTPDTTSHSIGNAPASDLVRGRVPHLWWYWLLLGLILGSEYGYISITKRDGRHTWELTLLNEVSIACDIWVSMDVSNFSV